MKTATIALDMLKKCQEKLMTRKTNKPYVVVVPTDLFILGKKEKLIYKENGKSYYNDPYYGKLEVIEHETL